MPRPLLKLGAALMVCAMALAACDLPSHHAAPSGAAPSGFNMQGEDVAAFMSNPNVQAYYDLTVRTFAAGADRVDFPAYQTQSYALFRKLGTSMGVPPEAMQDHLKAIPAQVRQIVAEDPAVLKDFASFSEALIGPP